MFTGIIHQLGEVLSVTPLPSGARLRCDLPGYDDLARGESVAVNGVCLTFMPAVDGGHYADLSSETLARTTLGELAPGDIVNLERALRLSDRLGGHLVQGHVDTTGFVIEISRRDGFADFRWEYPSEFSKLVIPKGSIAVDGVSLTIVDPDATSFGAAIIPETLERTNLGRSMEGQRVNLEFDMMGKYALGQSWSSAG